MTEEEKKEYEKLKSLLYTGQISQYGKRKLIDIIEKQDTEIQQVLDDYQELGKDYHKLECECESKDTEINKLNNVIDRMAEDIIDYEKDLKYDEPYENIEVVKEYYFGTVKPN